MNSRYRFSRRNNFRTGFRRRPSFYRGNGVVKRARGNMRAANQQNDVSNVTINLLKTCFAGVSGAASVSEPDENNLHVENSFDLGTTAINIYDLLRHSDFFTSYAGMYDQFRINSIKVKVTPVQWSVFDQSRSTSNVNEVGMGDKYGPETYTSVSDIGEFHGFGDEYHGSNLNQPIINRYIIVEDGKPKINDRSLEPVAVPSPEQYVRNPDYMDGDTESSSHPKFIVPGINPNVPDSYIKIGYINDSSSLDTDEQQVYVEYLDAGINYIANIKGIGLYAYNYSSGSDVVVDYYGQIGTNVNGTVKFGSSTVYASIADGNDNIYPYIYPQALTVVTAWDRTGLSTSQFIDMEKGYVVNDDNGVSELVDYSDNPFIGPMWFCTIGDNVTTYSSAQTKQLVGGSTFNHIRYLYPSSVQEKSTYYSTDSLREQLVPDRRTSNKSKYVYTSSVFGDENIEKFIKPDELCNLYESPNVPFKPTFLIGILGHNDVSSYIRTVNSDGKRIGKIEFTGMIKPVKFNLEFDIGVTFRGLRKAQVV